MIESINLEEKMYLSQIEELKRDLENAVRRGDEYFDLSESLKMEISHLKDRIGTIKETPPEPPQERKSTRTITI